MYLGVLRVGLTKSLVYLQCPPFSFIMCRGLQPHKCAPVVYNTYLYFLYSKAVKLGGGGPALLYLLF